MRYYKQLDESGALVAIGTGPGGTEITEAEYSTLLTEIREKVAYVEKVYSGEIGIDDAPEEWREEIQRRVDERIAADGEAAQQEVTGDEFMSMIEGVL